ncbi:helix-turn-helix transcriptional regulator [Bacteroides ilei]|uniref:AraC family transcriptional regulator n=1 Tax=Bacteroides ilei TaxID=1907658 RepID=UPI003AB399F7
MSVELDRFHPLVLNVGLAIHNADWNWVNVRSPFMRIYYVWEGYAKLKLPSGIFDLKPHYMYFIPSFTTHSYICDSYFSLYYIHLYENNLDGTSILDDWELPTEIKADSLDMELMKRLCEINPFMKLPQSDPASYDNKPTLIKSLITNESRPMYDKVESRGIAYIIISRFLKHACKKSLERDDRIVKTIDYIRNHLYSDIKIGDLAQQVFLSTDHFIKLFKHEMHTTPLQYITKKKIEKAQLLLATCDLSVKSISYKLMFDDYSYFCWIFKKITGVTPKEYRLTVK